jgi:threonine aldolase
MYGLRILFLIGHNRTDNVYLFKEDPTVNQLQARVAELTGHEAGLFCSSGTMTNQVCIVILKRLLIDQADMERSSAFERTLDNLHTL